ncbi:histidine kinase [Streptomyces sp. NPDC046465]|uniref:sensor histidine kinase n=1 Tax=Streptomyces sp. NPDC046465 TaxID=3155810 RepID=UPI0033C1799E
MSASPRVSLVKYAPPGVWAAVSWLLGMAFAARAYSGLPLMPTSGNGSPAPLEWLVIVGTAGAVLLAARFLERRPMTALGLLIGCSYGATLAIDETGITFLHYAAIDIAAGYIVATGTTRARHAAFALALGVLPAYALLRQLLGLPLQLPHTVSDSWSDWQTPTLTAAVAWLTGDSVRRARAYAQRLSSQATAQAVTAERLRIAREMHDTVAHSIGIIALQAGAAARVVETQPVLAREAMAAVETAGRETLAGLRRMLGALRESEPGQGADCARELAPRGPAEGLADVERLAASTTAAGVRVDVTWRGERRPLPWCGTRPPPPARCPWSTATRRSSSRSRTAAGAGAGAGAGAVRKPRPTAAERARAPRARARGTGYGLVGMGERVALLHGEFSAAPRPDGGFRVRARLPLPLPLPLSLPGASTSSRRVPSRQVPSRRVPDDGPRPARRRPATRPYRPEHGHHRRPRHRGRGRGGVG